MTGLNSYVIFKLCRLYNINLYMNIAKARYSMKTNQSLIRIGLYKCCANAGICSAFPLANLTGMTKIRYIPKYLDILAN